MYHHPKLVLTAIATLALLLTALLTSPPGSARAREEDKSAGGKDVLGDVLPPCAVARCGTTRMRNQKGVESISYGCDGKVLVSGAQGAVRLFDAQTGAAGKPAVIKSDYGFAACSPDGKWLATESPQGGLRLHEFATGASYEVKAGVGYVAPVFSGDSSLVACVSTGNIIAVADVKTRSIKAHLKMSESSTRIGSLALSPDSKLLAVGGAIRCPRTTTSMCGM